MKKLSILTFLLVFIFSAGVFARYHGHKMHKWWENEEMVKSVGLSEEQLTEIKKIDAGYQDQFNKLHDEIKKLHKDLEKEFNKMGPYLEKLHIDKKDFNNTCNNLKRALNQPNEGNIQNAINQIDSFVGKLAA